jgi:hypothetical protein
MSFSHFITGLAVSLTGLLPMSCHHKPATTAPAGTAATATADTNSTNAPADPYSLGEVTLTNHSEHCVFLNNGKECDFAAKSLDKDSAQIVVTLKSKTSAGTIHDMIVTQIDAKNGVPVEAVLGDAHVTFTPALVTE